MSVVDEETFRRRVLAEIERRRSWPAGDRDKPPIEAIVAAAHDMGLLTRADGGCPSCGRELGALDAPGLVGRDHPETSKRAAWTPTKGGEAWRVLEALQRFGPSTSDELAARGVSPSVNQAGARLLQLRDGGYVRRVLTSDGDVVKQRTRSGASAEVQELTPVGRALLDAS